MGDLHMIAGYIPMSAQMADEVESWQRALRHAAELDRIGPPHHPDRWDMSPGARLLLTLDGRPAGRLRR